MDSGARVFPIACHVDYWGSLPVDPYMDAYCTEMQRSYAQLWGAPNIYTPNMVINGREQWSFVGGNTTTLEAGLDDVMGDDVTTGVSLWVTSYPWDDPVVFDFEVVDPPPGEWELVVVPVQRGIVREITAGENGGQTLEHDNVALGWHSQGAETAGSASIEQVDDYVWDEVSLMALVRDLETLEVVGATAVHLADLYEP